MTDRSSSRKYNMDLERVILIFMVIVLHYNNRDMGGALNSVSSSYVSEIFVRLTQSLAVCAVDAFVIISGYFAARRTETVAATDASESARARIPWRKALRLLLTCSFYRTAGYLLHVLWITHDFSLRVLIGYMIPNNWFVCLFVTLLLLSPWLNGILGRERASAASPGRLTALVLILFSVIPSCVSLAGDLAHVNIEGLSTVTWHGDASGFNLALFVCCYITGYAIRSCRDYWDRFSWGIYAAMYLVLSCLTAALSRFTESVWNYSFVTVLLEAACLTLMFTRITVSGERIGRIISAIGGCSLGIFIWHTMPLMIFGLWGHFPIPGTGRDAYGGSFSGTISCFFGATLCMYALSLVWVLACRSVAGAAARKIGQKRDAVRR